MFKNPFSFDGRIRRTEYGFSFIIYVVGAIIVNAIIESSRDAAIIGLAYIPMLWFLWAQGAKRCHDVGNSGWWQLIPFYVFWLLFEDGQAGLNQYGDNPKGIQAIVGTKIQGGQNTGISGNGYQGGYSGGHNNPSSQYSPNQSLDNTESYKSGDLYK